MKKNPTLLLVVAAALVRDDGHILLQKRPEGREMAGLWEFPGGKLEAGEQPEAALARELELPYAAIGVVVNYAAGRSSSAHGIHFDDIELVLQESMVRVRAVLEGLCHV